jgi:hypothetical protein
VCLLVVLLLMMLLLALSSTLCKHHPKNELVGLDGCPSSPASDEASSSTE